MKLTTTALLISIFTASLAHAKGQYCRQNSEVKLECFVYTYSKIGKQIRFQKSRAEMQDLNAEQPDSSTCAANLSFVVSDGRFVFSQMSEDLKLQVYELTPYGYQYIGSDQLKPGKQFLLQNQPLNNGWSYTMTCEIL